MCTAFAAILRDAASDLERFAGIVRVEIYAGAGALAEGGGQVWPDFTRRCNVLSLLFAGFPVAVSTRLEHKIRRGDGLRTSISRRASPPVRYSEERQGRPGMKRT